MKQCKELSQSWCVFIIGHLFQLANGSFDETRFFLPRKRASKVVDQSENEAGGETPASWFEKARLL